MPDERPLTDDEREEIHEAALAALELLNTPTDAPEALVEALQAHVLARRMVKGAHDELVFQLGALFAHLLEEALGWELVEVRWESLEAPAVVAMDRSLAVLPFHAVGALFDDPAQPAVLASTYARLASGERPVGPKRDDYAVLLP